MSDERSVWFSSPAVEHQCLVGLQDQLTTRHVQDGDVELPLFCRGWIEKRHYRKLRFRWLIPAVHPILLCTPTLSSLHFLKAHSCSKNSILYSNPAALRLICDFSTPLLPVDVQLKNAELLSLPKLFPGVCRRVKRQQTSPEERANKRGGQQGPVLLFQHLKWFKRHNLTLISQELITNVEIIFYKIMSNTLNFNKTDTRCVGRFRSLKATVILFPEERPPHLVLLQSSL